MQEPFILFAVMTLTGARAEQKYIPVQGALRERNQEIEKPNKTSHLDGISEEACCVNISSAVEAFCPAGKLLKWKVNNPKQLQEVPETDQIFWAPLCQSKQELRVPLRPKEAELYRRLSDKLTEKKRPYQLPGKKQRLTLQPLKLPASCAVCSGFPAS